MLLYFLTYKLEIFPNAQYVPLTEDPFEWANHLILPWFTLAILSIGFYSRVLRSNMLDVMNEDYVRTARAKGLSEGKVMRGHVLRNSLIPIVTLFGLDFGATIAGTAIITEYLFSIDGVGNYAAEAAFKTELPPIIGRRSLRRLLSRSDQHPGRHLLRLPRPTRAAWGDRFGVSPAPLLSVEHLRVGFATEGGLLQAVDEVSFDVSPGEVVAIVGESGSGKSVTAQTIMGLTRSKNTRIEGSARFEGENLLEAADADLRRLRGDRIAMVFQDPMTSFNPVYRLGDQIGEAIRAHRDDVSKKEARGRAVELFEAVGIPKAASRVDDYPHQFSGGMRQRAMIAMALALEPDLLIADEPTTALDVTIQAQILDLLRELNRVRNLATILITHDLGVVAEIADRVLVMYAGRVVEQGTLDEIFYDPQHPYTWGLLGSLTRLDKPRPQRLPQISGAPPSLLALPEGCSFRPRCPHEFESCIALPPLEARLRDEPSHCDRCWLSPEAKREKRLVTGQIGLEAPSP